MSTENLSPSPSQWYVLWHDKWLLSCLTWLPIVLALSIWWIFSQGIIRDLPYGVVDLEHSTLSRQLTRELDATASLQVTASYASVAEAKQALINNDIYAYAVIPKGFSKGIYSGQARQVSVFYNSQYILVGKLINSATLQAHGTFNAQVSAFKQLAKGDTNGATALGKAVVIRNQITPLFNKGSNYAQFLVSAIIPALWQIIIMVGTILILAANYRIYGLRGMLGKAPMRQLARLTGCYLPIFVLFGMAFLAWFYAVIQWPFEGDLWPVVYGQLLTVLACMSMGALFFFLTLDPARAMSFAGAFTAPSFAFMGVTFPATDMNYLATFWRNLLPISHYIEAQIAQASYAVTSWQTISQLSSSMWGYIFILLLLKPLINKKLARAEAA